MKGTFSKELALGRTLEERPRIYGLKLPSVHLSESSKAQSPPLTTIRNSAPLIENGKPKDRTQWMSLDRLGAARYHDQAIGSNRFATQTKAISIESTSYERRFAYLVFAMTEMHA